MNKYRGKCQQKVTVEHVHVEAGGQARSIHTKDDNRNAILDELLSDGANNIAENYCAGWPVEHSDDCDQSFQRIATSVTRVRDGTVG